MLFFSGLKSVVTILFEATPLKLYTAKIPYYLKIVFLKNTTIINSHYLPENLPDYPKIEFNQLIASYI